MKLIIIDSKGESNAINIMESDPVSELRNQIKRKFNIQDNIELVFNGTIIEDNDNLAELEIKDGMTINMVGEFKAGLNKL